MDDEQGYPHDLGNLHLSFANHDLSKAYAWYFAKVAYTYDPRCLCLLVSCLDFSQLKLRTYPKNKAG